jgi:putative chitinase
MSFLARFFGFGAQRPEAAPAAVSATAAPVPAPAAPQRSQIVVAGVGDHHPGGTLGPLADSLAMPPLVEMVRAAGFRDAAAWAEVLRRPMRDAGIATRLRVAAALANFAHETGGGARVVEGFNYWRGGAWDTFGARATVEVLALCRPMMQAPAVSEANQERIANLVYGGEFGRRELGNVELGDGWRFRGRGLIQVTGRANYARLARELGLGLDTLVALMETREGAADTACRWWRWAGVNALADAGDIAAVRRRVNGPKALGLEDVRARYEAVLAA